MRIWHTFLVAALSLLLAPMAQAQDDSLLVTLDTDNLVIASGGSIWLRATIENHTAETQRIDGQRYNPGPFITLFEFRQARFPTIEANGVFHGDLLEIFAHSQEDKTPTKPGVYGPYGFAVFTSNQANASNNAMYRITVTGTAVAPEPGTFALTLTGTLVFATRLPRRRNRA